jgi:hypothetical protein
MRRQELAAAVVGEGLRPILAEGLADGLAALLEAGWDVDPMKRPTAAQLAAQIRQLQVNE